ncbi:MAG TPA: hypothetical protein VE176_05035, partial [Candidatus Limnocylindrales bacterium]|nr:hypothetical protein [Candidatus Limnocylindrales bacterium]
HTSNGMPGWDETRIPALENFPVSLQVEVGLSREKAQASHSPALRAPTALSISLPGQRWQKNLPTG